MRRPSVVFFVVLLSALAWAEGAGRRQRLPDTTTRLHDVASMWPMAGGGFIALGSSKLRILPPGGKSLVTLYQGPKDGLYRVAADEPGIVLAAWEKEQAFHYFVPAKKKHVAIPWPVMPGDELWDLRIEYLAVVRGGREALVHMQALRKDRTDVNLVYRVSLEGAAPPVLLYKVEGAHQLHVTRDLAVYMVPVDPHQLCEHLRCDPIATVVVYETDGHTVREVDLVTRAERDLGSARMIWGDDDDEVVMQLGLNHPVNERLLLRWRKGEAKASILPFPRQRYSREKAFVGARGEVLRVLVRDGDEGLDLRRHFPDGTEQLVSLEGGPVKNSMRTPVDLAIHDAGVRRNGGVWMHWGDKLLLFPPDFAGPPIAYDVESLRGRGTEWGDVGIYGDEPEALWLGIEAGGGRNFARVTLADIDQHGKPWPLK